MENDVTAIFRRVYNKECERLGVKDTYDAWLEREAKGWAMIGKGPALKRFGIMEEVK